MRRRTLAAAALALALSAAPSCAHAAQQAEGASDVTIRMAAPSPALPPQETVEVEVGGPPATGALSRTGDASPVAACGLGLVGASALAAAASVAAGKEES